MSVAAFLKDSLRKVIPKALLKERGVVARLGPGPGSIYVRLRLLNLIGINRITRRRVPPHAHSFVFVCFGNIMRSPMADALLKHSAKEAGLDIRSDSAGLHAIPGKEAHPWAQAAASEMGISLSSHQAKLLTSEMVAGADAVLAMDFQNLAELLDRYPHFQAKFFLLGACGSDPRIQEIPDPYLGDLDTTRQCYGVLKMCVENLLATRVAGSSNRGESFAITRAADASTSISSGNETS